MAPNGGASFERDPGERRKGLLGSVRTHCPETKQPAPLARASRTDGGMNAKGSWSSTPNAPPGTDFAEGVSTEVDGGEFSDNLLSNRSHGRLRENHAWGRREIQRRKTWQVDHISNTSILCKLATETRLIFSIRSQSRLSDSNFRQRQAFKPDQSESWAVVWVRSEARHYGPRPRCVASRGLTHVGTIRR